ncbi:sn-glycerol-3-phosphate ABC transporter substrate-binding protein UgpB [Caenispirillum bisanense]|uniref:sn-glycerol-3-phosphate-binding periplasmic protein UgpB n=1 Tax=Caenispirillum bisanense TaxID=414052 RepID=A0A286G888_9PROT|nr:sn-glycerol-3-phosphate ABC transporter substrate-binding protein UgpB [Caenispirillum bisanense]SOD91743.1 carbohydrate ABC transporter substrate-binding protein, CUT1 family [Caenispirillum bisanense]
MKAIKYGVASLALAATLGAWPALAAPTEIQFWHAMGGGVTGEKVVEYAEKFNASQDAFKVVPVYKGNYTETLTAAVAAFRAKQQPHIVQVFEVGTASMMAAEGAVYPVHQLMAEHGGSFDPDQYLDAVKSYYTTTDGKMLSMPFNSSTPVMFYNKDAFAKAGIAEPPKTWAELAEASRKIMAVKAEGQPTCGFTTGWQSWVQLETFGALHDAAFATKDNGFGGFDTELAFDAPPFTKHIADMKEWQKDRTFVYGGRRGDPNPLFLTGECAMLMNSSAYYGAVKDGAKFAWGIAPLPYDDSVIDQPKNSIIGGATLWVLQGHDGKEYEGVAEFLKFLSTDDVQLDWHKATGYVPITHGAYEAAKAEGFYDKTPGADVAILQLTRGEPGPNSKGLRLGNFTQIRDIINEELEAVWSDKKSADQALSDAASRGNDLLRKFEKTH